MTDAQQPANWYPDPTGRHQYRYWSGAEWTDHVADDQVTATDSPAMPAAAPASAAPAAVAPAASAPAAFGAPAAAAAPAPTPAPRAPKRRGSPLWAGVAVVGGLALIGGSFLNALTASLGGVDIDKSYFDGDGPLELGIGVLVVVFALLVAFGAVSRGWGWGIFALGVIGALVAVADIFDVKNSLDDFEKLGGTGSIGPALWLCLGGGILALLGGMLAFVLAPKNVDALPAADSTPPAA